MRNLRREPSFGTLYFWLSLNAALAYPPKVHHVEARLLVLTLEVNQNPDPTVGSSRRPPVSAEFQEVKWNVRAHAIH
jgi:hypothetical protein